MTLIQRGGTRHDRLFPDAPEGVRVPAGETVGTEMSGTSAQNHPLRRLARLGEVAPAAVAALAVLTWPAAAEALGVAAVRTSWQLGSLGMLAAFVVLARRLDRTAGDEGPVARLTQAALAVAAVVAVLGVVLAPTTARACLAVLAAAWSPAALARWVTVRLAARWAPLPAQRLVLVGPLSAVERLAGEVGRAPSPAVVEAVLVPGLAGAARLAEPLAQAPAARVLGSLEELGAWLAGRDALPDSVLVAPATDSEVVEHLSWALEESGIRLAVALPVRDVAPHRLHRVSHGTVPATAVDLPRFAGPWFRVKSLLDRVGAAVALLLLSPALLAIAVAVKATSPGPVLYRQTRIGMGGREFSMLKFRSMVPDAHARLAEVLRAEGVDEITPFYKPKNDPRVTPVGRVLRKYSLDELPQLINVLRGDMSLVGPRPQIDREVASYDARTRRRLLVKPGCTGLWQTSGRSRLTPEEGIRLDVWYAENCTPLVDLRILARTVRAVAVGDGAL